MTEQRLRQHTSPWSLKTLKEIPAFRKYR